MNCFICSEKLRKDNLIGACRVHRSLAPKTKERMKQYAKKNFETLKEYKKIYAQSNTEKINDSYKKRMNNIQYKKAHKIRVLTNKLLNRKTYRSQKIVFVGCTAKYFREYIEKQFIKGMSWEKRELWHIDHIKSLNSFNLIDENEYKKACHYTNVRPLFVSDNLKRQKEYKLPRVPN